MTEIEKIGLMMMLVALSYGPLVIATPAPLLVFAIGAIVFLFG